jgi:hypothetical protein
MTSTEVLLRALAGFLHEEVQPELEGAAAYRVRIARNLLELLEREARFAAQLSERAEAAAAQFGLAPESLQADLARALRNGSLDTVPDRALQDFLRERAMLQLMVDNPRYSGLRMARERWPLLAARLSEDIPPQDRHGSPGKRSMR